MHSNEDLERSLFSTRQLRNPFGKLTTVFQMSPEAWFKAYTKKGGDKHKLYDEYKSISESIYAEFPELPFGNMWAAKQLSAKIPEGSLLHIGVSNTRRCWNLFPLPKGVESSCNVGCCGIDGCMSTLIGASLVNPDRLCYLVLGDFTFFYDLNSLGNRHAGRNLRIMLINNGVGAEFRLFIHPCYSYGEEGRPYMAAEGHYGHKSPRLVKHFAEDLGYKYLSASTKEEFETALKDFTNPTLTDRSIIFEVFTTPENESEALRLARSIRLDKVRGAARTLLGDKGIKAVKSILGRK